MAAIAAGKIMFLDTLNRFQLLFDSTNTGIIISDQHDSIVLVNRGAVNLFGFSEKDQLLGLNIFTLFANASHETYRNILTHGQQALLVGLRQGNDFIAETSASIWREGEDILYMSLIFDRTEEHRKEELLASKTAAVRRSNDILNSVLTGMADGVVAANASGEFIIFNPAAQRILGGPADTIASWSKFYDIRRLDGTPYETDEELPIWQAMHGKIVDNFDMIIHHPTGQEVVVQVNARPLREGGGVAVFHDVTKQTQFKEELIKTNKDLEQFAYTASHDLQEPLRMVAAYCQLIERRYSDKLDAEGLRFLKYAVDGANRMKDLINDLLQFSRIGTKPLAVQSTSIMKCAIDALDNLQEAVRERKATVKIDLPDIHLDIDGRLIIQVFQNLIANAIKFQQPATTPAVSIAARQEGNYWLFSIQDNGIGIAEEHINKLFILFQRLNTKYQGTGIGLAICKKIVERHGGKIWLESVVGNGSTFFFTLPLS